MTAPPSGRVGFSQAMTVRSSGSSAWRGLAMVVQGFTINPVYRAVPWNVLVAQTDGIRSTGSYTFSGIAVATGAAGVVPAGMAGIWRIAANLYITNVVGSEGDWAFQVICNDFDWQGGWESDTTSFGQTNDTFSAPIPPFVRVLAVGDKIWTAVGGLANTNTAGSFGTVSSNFLMEYLGPTP